MISFLKNLYHHFLEMEQRLLSQKSWRSKLSYRWKWPWKDWLLWNLEIKAWTCRNVLGILLHSIIHPWCKNLETRQGQEPVSSLTAWARLNNSGNKELRMKTLIIFLKNNVGDVYFGLIWPVIGKGKKNMKNCYNCHNQGGGSSRL